MLKHPKPKNYSLTCAAITLCRSAIRVHLAHTQSFHLQKRLCPLSVDTTPWLRHRAHLGVRWYFSEARKKRACDRPDTTGRNDDDDDVDEEDVGGGGGEGDDVEALAPPFGEQLCALCGWWWWWWWWWDGDEAAAKESMFCKADLLLLNSCDDDDDDDEDDDEDAADILFLNKLRTLSLTKIK